MSLLVMTRDLAYKLDMMDAFYVQDRMLGIEGLGVDVRKFGNTLALMSKHSPIDQFNSIRGLMREDEDLLEEMLGFYTDNDVKVRIDMIPSELTGEISSKLIEKNILPRSFHTVLYRESKKLDSLTGNRINVRRIEEDEFDLFLDVYLKGFGIPEGFLERAKDQRSFWLRVPDFHLYLATFDDTPIGASVLYSREMMGYLAGASTLPAFRGMGCQQQQLIKRINDAVELGCELITTQATFDSTSQRNMQRNGFQIAFTKGIWMAI